MQAPNFRGIVMAENKLFAVLLGGRIEGCHIELHDVVFVVGKTLEETYPALISKWFGSQKRLHIDSSMELDIIDGHKIRLSSRMPENSQSQKSLYFTNFGGYKPGVFGELHEMAFYVGHSKNEIKCRAKDQLCVNSSEQHCDDNLMVGGKEIHKEIDDVIKIGKIDEFWITLEPSSEPTNLNIESRYRRLDL